MPRGLLQVNPRNFHLLFRYLFFQSVFYFFRGEFVVRPFLGLRGVYLLRVVASGRKGVGVFPRVGERVVNHRCGRRRGPRWRRCRHNASAKDSRLRVGV